MILTILKAGAVSAALLVSGAAYAQAPFDFVNGPDADKSAAAASPAPFNFLNGPAATDMGAAPPHRMGPRYGRMHAPPGEASGP